MEPNEEPTYRSLSEHKFVEYTKEPDCIILFDRTGLKRFHLSSDEMEKLVRYWNELSEKD